MRRQKMNYGQRKVETSAYVREKEESYLSIRTAPPGVPRKVTFWGYLNARFGRRHIVANLECGHYVSFHRTPSHKFETLNCPRCKPDDVPGDRGPGGLAE